MKRIAVLTSGGDAPGMNAAIRSVVRTALFNDMSVIGIKRGYNGLMMRSKDQTDDFELLTSRSVSGRIHRGGTFLMTARCMEFFDEEVVKDSVKNLRRLGVEGLVSIGGNGTFAGALSIQKNGFPVIGIPGTIDNDLEYTDYTIGFDTAVNTACECVNRIRETSDSHERASIITVMGRDCGDIAVSTAIACGAEVTIVPEVEWYIEDVADKVKWAHLNGKRSTIIILAEGAVASLKSDIAALSAQYPKLEGMNGSKLTSSQIAKIIEELSDIETRATVLGYTQRGGTPSAFDRILATRLGARAVELLRDDISGRAVGLHNNQLIDVSLEEALNSEPFNKDLFNLVDITGAIKR